MKKFLFLIVILLIALGVIYKMDIKPETKEVVKELKPSTVNVPK